MLYIGVDAHSKTSWITIMDEKGKIVKREQINSSRKDVQKSLGRYRQPMKAVVEASYSWGPIYDWLDEVADDVILAHPGKVRAIAEARIKTDKIDSETLAHLLWADILFPRLMLLQRTFGQSSGFYVKECFLCGSGLC